MKRLSLMRHAKSEWNSGHTNDFDLPLTYQGKNDAPKMARVLIKNNLIPQLALISPAIRSADTWNLMVRVFQEQKLPMEERPIFGFYNGGLKQIQRSISRISNDFTNVLIIGHNPGWSEATSWFLDRDIRLTTSSLVTIEHPSDTWSDAIHSNEWLLRGHFFPKSVDF